MDKFIARYRSHITGVLLGFDRLVFRGSLLPLMRDGGMFFFLQRAGVRLLDFKRLVSGTSQRVKAAAFEQAERLGRPVHYLESSRTDKVSAPGAEWSTWAARDWSMGGGWDGRDALVQVGAERVG